MIVKVARSQAPVHICGESGTGKELVAQLIHEAGPRREAPFVAVNCGAIPTELMESELFGHKRGSFTGAVADKKGMIKAADGGTLFLDEVADLPLHMQVKLLRVIQEKSVRPVGETREESGGRAHPERHSQESRGAGGRRRVPRGPVLSRQRDRDARALACASGRRMSPSSTTSIVQRLAQRHARWIRPALTPEAMERLKGYAFPGNVRELENILERALALCSGGVRSTPHDLQLREAADAPRPPQAAACDGRTGRPAGGHRTRCHREGAGADALQQDGRREGAGDELSRAALPRSRSWGSNESGGAGLTHRVTLLTQLCHATCGRDLHRPKS